MKYEVLVCLLHSYVSVIPSLTDLFSVSPLHGSLFCLLLLSKKVSLFSIIFLYSSTFGLYIVIRLVVRSHNSAFNHKDRAMAMGSIYAVVPAVAAAVGFYFVDRNYVKEIRRWISDSNQNMIATMKEQAKDHQKPKLAPQLDGLYCFETIVIS